MSYATGPKRVLDALGAVIVLALVLVPGALIALFIVLGTRGPVFFRQTRSGRKGRAFSMIKFRSMTAGSEFAGAGILVEKNDARITTVGAWLRKTSLDELPQVLNIARGEMSFIGPRPALPFQVAQYTPEQRKRLEVTPGITGWAQVNGRNAIPWDERIRFDCEYVDRVSFLFDLEILFRTLRVIANPSDQIAARAHFGQRPPEASGGERSER